MVRAAVSASSTEVMLRQACARNVPAELHYETPEGVVVVWRTRLVQVTERHIIAERPSRNDQAAELQEGQPLLAHFSVGRSRYQFQTDVEVGRISVRLNERHRILGIALRKPRSIKRSQRRAHLRVSLAGTEPVVVHLARPHPSISDACAIDGRVGQGQIVNLSAGGILVLIDNRIMSTAKVGERFYMTFGMPEVEEPFNMLGTVRHLRVVESSDSLRVAMAFRPWRGIRMDAEQRRIQTYVAGRERLFLRRRKS
ncbi:MAG: PilZ domain-containing protein [Planctomycetes bacterium]|nr:PilZ domain-containing protein [Planctomycetota bacterium]